KKCSGNVSRDAKMDIETFVQRYYLKQILICANRRFEKLSGYQYQLILKESDDFGKVRNEGLDLMVHSLITGQNRDVSTLSGGESFMAALSLALGMADQIQANVSSLCIHMMFIDEGFGSLDDASRNQSIRVLKEMAQDHKCIGIISHVSELKNQIENQLLVSKDEKGSHAKWNFL
ncbi:MAG: SbcC/MukB-like Walker B domain-containing protein, partial [Floccifex sp.]